MPDIQTYIWMTEKDVTSNNLSEYGLMEFILSQKNLNDAYLQVIRNKGAGGVDKMQVESLRDYIFEHKDEIITSILQVKYRLKQFEG